MMRIKPAWAFSFFLYAKFASCIMERQLAQLGEHYQLIEVAGPNPALFLFKFLFFERMKGHGRNEAVNQIDEGAHRKSH